MRRLSPRVAMALALAFLALTYGNTLLNGFGPDDLDTIQRNPHLSDPRSLLGYLVYGGPFSRSYAGVQAQFYRPLFWAIAAAERLAWGSDPFGYHLTNLLLHLGNAALVMALGATLSGRPLVGIVAGLLWGVHPIQSEVVAYIGARNTSLCTLFLLAAVLFSLRARQPAGSRGTGRRLGLSLASAGASALALLTYEQAVVAPLLVLLAHAWRAHPSGRPARRAAMPAGERGDWRRELLPGALPHVLVVAAYVGLRAAVLPFGEAVTTQGILAGLGSRVLLLPKLLAAYLGLLAWPRTLSFDRSQWVTPPASAGAPDFLAPAALLVLLVVAAALAWRKVPEAGLGGIWFLAALAPVSNLVPVYIVAAERFLYLPSIGLALAGVLAGARLLAGVEGMRWAPVARRGVAAGLALATLAAAGRAAVRNRDFRDEVSLAEATITASPETYMMRKRLGVILLTRGECARAEVELLQAVERNRADDASGYSNLGAAYRCQGKTDLAIGALRKAIDLDPRHPIARLNLGIIYREQGRLDLAHAEARRAVELAPGLPPARDLLRALEEEIRQRRTPAG